MNELAAVIRSLRIRQKLSQTKLSEKLGISQSALARIESGATENISIEVGKKLSMALDISFNELFDIEVNKSKSSSRYSDYKLIREVSDIANGILEQQWSITPFEALQIAVKIQNNKIISEVNNVVK